MVNLGLGVLGSITITVYTHNVVGNMSDLSLTSLVYENHRAGLAVFGSILLLFRLLELSGLGAGCIFNLVGKISRTRLG